MNDASNPSEDLPQLLDAALVRDIVGADVVRALERFPAGDLLTELRWRFLKAESSVVASQVLEICADVLGPSASLWIREIAESDVPTILIHSFCRALAKCIGDTAFDIAAERLAHVDQSELPLMAHALLQFDAKSRILDWIELQLSSPSQTVKQYWGQLAALAGISWKRAAEWIDRGKPLSLVALDALNCCWNYDGVVGGWLTKYRPKLLDPGDIEEMRERLRRHAQAQPWPRVEQAVKMIDEHLEDICAT